MKRVPRDKYTTSLSPEHAPVIEIEPGEKICVEAPSAFGGVFDEKGNPSSISVESNPAAGPIAVKGIKPGETIAVFIENIKPVGYGKAVNTVYTVEGDHLTFMGGLSVPIDPNIGTIGVAPGTVEEATSNKIAGPHGGNMDCRDITEGSAVFFKARVEGGCLGLGDVHLAMGDGEVEGQGVESAADITLAVYKAKAVSAEWPWLILNDEIMAIGGHEDYREALHIAYESLVLLCCELFDADRQGVRSRMSPAGWVKVCQSCCEVKTVRVSLPLNLFGTSEEALIRRLAPYE